MFFKNFFNKIKDLEKSNKNLEEKVEKLEEIIYRDKMNERIYELEKKYNIKIEEEYLHSIYADYYCMNIKFKKYNRIMEDSLLVPLFGFSQSKKLKYINSEKFENQILGILNKHHLLEIKKDKKGDTNGTK